MWGGLSQEVNQLLEAEHAKGTLTIERFREIAPHYYEHVKQLSSRCPHRFIYVLGKDSYKSSVLRTIDEFVLSYPNSTVARALIDLRSRWLSFEDPPRDTLRRDVRRNAQRLRSYFGLTDAQLQWIEDGILSFARQRNFSRLADGRLIVGSESSSWVVRPAEIRVESVINISGRAPSNPFLSGLSWDGLACIRKDQDFMNSLYRMRHASGTDLPDAVSYYNKALTKAYEYAADEGLVPSPFRWREITVKVVRWACVGAGALLGGLAEGLVGAIGGAIVGHVASEELGRRTSGFLMKSNIFHPAPSFRQLYLDIKESSEA